MVPTYSEERGLKVGGKVEGEGLKIVPKYFIYIHIHRKVPKPKLNESHFLITTSVLFYA